MPSYPIGVLAGGELEGRDRLSTLLRAFVVIPWVVVAWLYLLGACLCAVAAWFAILATGRYPRALYEFNARAVRMAARANALGLLLTDVHPPFGGDDDESFPVRIGFPPPAGRYSRLLAALRPIVGIPVLLLGYVQWVIAWACSTVAWFSILFTGRVPPGVLGAIRAAVAFWARATAYFLLMTEDYPPFGYAGPPPSRLAPR